MKEFKISNRLLKCAEMVNSGAKIADIGTDHAYIPIYLALNGKISYALACDISPGPLNNAKNNIEKYKFDKIIKTRLSDGLESIEENEADEIIIAGMGGNTIIKILQDCKWKNKKEKKFILQPVQHEDDLRLYLAESGHKITKEKAVICSGKVYTVMVAVFTGVPYSLSPEEVYIGKLSQNLDNDAKAYIKKQIKNLRNHRDGAHHKENRSEEEYYSGIIKNLENICSIS